MRRTAFSAAAPSTTPRARHAPRIVTPWPPRIVEGTIGFRVVRTLPPSGKTGP